MKQRILYFFIVALFILTSCGLFGPGDGSRKLYVFSNTTQKFYLLNARSLEILKDIPTDISDSLVIHGMKLSSNGDFLIFNTKLNVDPKGAKKPTFGFAMYDLKKERFLPLYFTDLPDSGTVSFMPAQNPDEPGLIYAHFRDYGTYAIDVFDQEEKPRLISDEHAFSLGKTFAHSPDGEWIIVDKIRHREGGENELQFYRSTSDLSTPSFILNEAGRDSIRFYDYRFSEGMNKLFVVFRLSVKGIEDYDRQVYFGSYDLQSRELTWSDLKFPWSRTLYNMAYSPRRDEIYLAGGFSELHIIDAESYERKAVIEIPGKTYDAPTNIVIVPGEHVALICSPADNLVQVLDLSSRTITKTNTLPQIWPMIIP